MKLKNFWAVPPLLITFLIGGCGEGPRPAPGSPPSSSPPSSNSPSTVTEASVGRVLKVLPENGFKAEITVANPPTKLKIKQREELTVKVKNTSGAEWPMRGRAGDGIFQVNLGDAWRTMDGKQVKVDERAFLPNAVKPGEQVAIRFAIVAPDKAGDFVVEIDMVQEGIAWFVSKGSVPAKLKIKVE